MPESPVPAESAVIPPVESSANPPEARAVSSEGAPAVQGEPIAVQEQAEANSHAPAGPSGKRGRFKKAIAALALGAAVGLALLHGFNGEDPLDREIRKSGLTPVEWLFRQPSSRGSSDEQGHPFFTDRQLDYASLKEFVETYDIRSLDELLPNLPGHVRHNWFPVTESKSAQFADKETPRIIMRNGPGTLLLAFDYTGRELEIIRVKEDKKYEMRELTFSSDGSEGAHFSLPNPDFCLGCHKKDPRPNLEPFTSHHKKLSPEGNSWKGMAGKAELLNDDEARYLAKLLYGPKSKQPLYKHLRNPVLPRALLDKAHLGEAGPAETWTGPFMLHDALLVNNRERMVAILRQTPEYEKYRSALLAGLAGVEDVWTYTPWEDPATAESKWKELFEDTQEHYSRLQAEHREALKRDPKVAVVVTNLRFLLERRGIPIDHLGTSIQDKYLIFTSYKNIIPVADALTEADPALLPLARILKLSGDSHKPPEIHLF